MKTKITVRTVGQAFAATAQIVRGGRVVHTTAIYPYGMRAAAYQAALRELDRRGWTIAADAD